MMGFSRTSNLPSPGYFSSNHVLVNRERARVGLSPLHRNVRLDALAREHAAAMATDHTLRPSVGSVAQLQHKLQAKRVGENTLRGSSIRAVHKEVMGRRFGLHSGQSQHSSQQCRCNLLAPAFTQFGMGTAVGTNGQLYLVQLFCGDEKLVVEDRHQLSEL